MSAPPEHRAGQQRFVSSINIPVQGENDTHASPSQPQQPKQQSTNERVIPIHVEGRDEPVIPKSNHSFSQPPPQPERVFNQRPSGFGTWNRGDGPYFPGEQQFHRGEPHNFYNDSHPDETHGNNVGSFKQQKPQTQQQAPNPPQPQQSQPSQPTPQQQQQQQPPSPPPPPPAIKLGPIEQIQRIQKDVLELMNRVEKFNGKPKDKDCVYLDEMLTRNLLKLDDVETEGKESIRNARKEAIKCIQKCISILEAKANANELLHSQLVDITKMPLNSLEVSGVSRSGTEASIGQDDSVSVDDQPNTEEASIKNDVTPMQTNELELPPVQDSTPTDQAAEPEKPEKEVTDVEMASEADKTKPITDPTGPPEGPETQPMEIQGEEPKEKKDKKKVKKKVDKAEKK